jgi:hypothetical protein
MRAADERSEGALDAYPNLAGTLGTMLLFPRIWGATESLEHAGEEIGPIEKTPSNLAYWTYRRMMNLSGKERQAKI